MASSSGRASEPGQDQTQLSAGLPGGRRAGPLAAAIQISIPNPVLKTKGPAAADKAAAGPASGRALRHRIRDRNDFQSVHRNSHFFKPCDEVFIFPAIPVLVVICGRRNFQHNLDRLNQGWGVPLQALPAERQIGGLKPIQRYGPALGRAGNHRLGQDRSCVLDQSRSGFWSPLELPDCPFFHWLDFGGLPKPISYSSGIVISFIHNLHAHVAEPVEYALYNFFRILGLGMIYPGFVQNTPLQVYRPPVARQRQVPQFADQGFADLHFPVSALHPNFAFQHPLQQRVDVVFLFRPALAIAGLAFFESGLLGRASKAHLRRVLIGSYSSLR